MLENLKKLIKSKKNKKENYHDEEDDSCNDDVFMISKLIFDLILLIAAIIFLVQNFKFLPDWAKAFSLIALLNPCLGGPISAIIIVFFTRKIET